MLNRCVLSRDRKTATEGAEVTRSGRQFQTRAAATATVRSRVRLTINDEDDSSYLLFAVQIRRNRPSIRRWYAEKLLLLVAVLIFVKVGR